MFEHAVWFPGQVANVPTHQHPREARLPLIVARGTGCGTQLPALSVVRSIWMVLSLAFPQKAVLIWIWKALCVGILLLHLQLYSERASL